MSPRIAVADIGGTHARFAIAEIDRAGTILLSEPVVLRTAEFAGIDTAWKEFGRRLGSPLPDALAVAFAGPIRGNALKLTNSNWTIQRDTLGSQLGVGRYLIVNDFEAIGHAVAALGPDHYRHVCGPEQPLPDSGVLSIVGPGTGLGVAGLIRHSDGSCRILPTEGGHIDFAPTDELEDRMVVRMRAEHGRAAVDRIASGPGLTIIYETLCEAAGEPVTHRDNKRLWAAAMAREDPMASAALDRFCRILGSVAGDYALCIGAVGLVVAGGLGLKLADHLPGSGFGDRFIAKGRQERLMNRIPVKLLTHPQPGLYGAAVAFAKELE